MRLLSLERPNGIIWNVVSLNSTKSSPHRGLPRSTLDHSDYSVHPRSRLGLLGLPLIPDIGPTSDHSDHSDHSVTRTKYDLLWTTPFRLTCLVILSLTSPHMYVLGLPLEIQCLHCSDLWVLPPFIPILYLPVAWTSTFSEHDAFGLQTLPFYCTI